MSGSLLDSHSWPVRVYYEDTDSGGIVYHANYLRFAERARTEFLRAHGFDHPTLRERHGGAFVVTHCTIDFHRPARLDDLLSVETSVADAGRVRLVLLQRVLRGDTLLVNVEVQLAFIGADGRPRRLPVLSGTASELAPVAQSG